ncbi:hypothetical protein [Arthrobacter sp. MMS18-M83]|uniref:hypothetical protein n=1 Tax=Arthrobacter sp. MMS18-M83 TaxID=2996261 RepID=UPI00227C555E|nr:hypothetical protein [Arthrobacter sp. MMS18-M83]WAH95739.1 hypothetical protein OW521_14965 [Arthrobacter sp. MMS18-M83]
MLQLPGNLDNQIERQPPETRHESPPSHATAPGVFLACPLHGTGVRLVHYAHKATAAPHDTLTYSAWVINDSGEVLTDVTLVLRSFTNAGLEELSYATGPSALSFGPMPAGGETELVFTYVVTENDQSHAGELISAMAVQAVTASGTRHWDEHDAITPISFP